MVVDSDCYMSLSCGNLSVERKDGSELTTPIDQLKTVMVSSVNTSVSVALLNELARSGVLLVFCNEKHEPSIEMTPMLQNFEASGHIIDQSLWEDSKKGNVWKKIVESKISSERRLLEYLGLPIPDKLAEYGNTVLPNDSSNREGQAAGVYFRALFGSGFIRHTFDETNAALNYGYVIERSAFCRVISLYGYHNALGINHRNRQNPFNLACDLMEPFRVFVDRIVYENRDRELDWEYKKLFVELLQTRVRYGDRTFCLNDALECYSLDVFRAMQSGDVQEIKEIDFEK